MTDEPPLTIMPDTKGWQRIVASQRQALYEKEQELERLRAENVALVLDRDNALMGKFFLQDDRDAMAKVVEAARALVREWDGENKGGV